MPSDGDQSPLVTERYKSQFFCQAAFTTEDYVACLQRAFVSIDASRAFEDVGWPVNLSPAALAAGINQREPAPMSVERPHLWIKTMPVLRKLAMPSRRARVIVLIVLSLVFLALAGVLGYRLTDNKRHWVDSFQSGSWIGAQLQKEYLQLDRDYYAFLHKGTPAAYDDLLLQFDIFWSRIPLIFESYEGRELRTDPELMASARMIRDSLTELDRLIVGLDVSDPSSQAEFQGALESIRVPVQIVAQQSLLLGPHLAELRSFVDSIGAYISLVISMAAIGVLIVVFAGLQTVEARRLARVASRAEQQAQDARRRLLSSIDAALDGFLIADADGRVLMVNRRFRELYPGLEGLIDGGADLATMLDAVLATGGPTMTADAMADARVRRARLRANQSRWEETLTDGRVLLVTQRLTERQDRVCVLTDITEQKRSEALLRDQLVAIEGASDGISITDADGRFTYMNAACLQIFGLDGQESILGKPWQALYDAETAAKVEEDATPDLEALGAWRGEVRAVRPDGTPYVQEIAITRLADGGIVGVNRDITDAVTAAAERQALREQLYESQKMEAIGRLAGGIAHDFNNILASIIGYATFLTEDLDEGSETAGFAHSILRSSERAKDLVQQILTFSRKADIQRTEQDLVPLISAAASAARDQAPINVMVVADTPDYPVISPVNAPQFSQVLTNLLVNGRDSLGERRGQVTISVLVRRVDAATGADPIRAVGRAASGDPVWTDTLPDGSNRMWVGAMADQELCADIRVQDTGSGISREVMERMFEPFFTTKPVGQGAGLGLSAVKGIVGNHGGALKIDTTPGLGTTVSVLMPLSSRGRRVASAELAPTDVSLPVGSNGDTAKAADGSAVSPMAPVGGRDLAPDPIENGGTLMAADRAMKVMDDGIILVLDDEPQVGLMIQRMLRRLGYTAAHSLTAQDALALIDRDPRVRLLITDQQMPHMTGDAVIAHLQRHHPDLPVILCTGFSEKFTRQQARAAGAAGFLEKPITANQLKEAIEVAYRGEKVVET